MRGLSRAALVAALPLFAGAAPTIPWGWAEGPSGRTELTDYTVPSDATNVIFVAGEIVFDGIVLADRVLSFAANPAGTTIVVDGTCSGFDLSGAPVRGGCAGRSSVLPVGSGGVAVRTVAIVLLATVFAGTAVGETGSEREERGKWRFSVGASVIGPVKSNLGVSNARVRQLSGFGESLIQSAAARHGVRPRAEAYEAGSGAADPNGVMKFDGKAWYDPHDSAFENDPDWSWNWRLHDPSEEDIINHGKAFVERTTYSEDFESVSLTTLGDDTGYSSDSSEWFPGLRVEAARELYRSEGERPWGVDIAVAFAYYFQRGLWKADGKIIIRGETQNGTMLIRFLAPRDR